MTQMPWLYALPLAIAVTAGVTSRSWSGVAIGFLLGVGGALFGGWLARRQGRRR